MESNKNGTITECRACNPSCPKNCNHCLWEKYLWDHDGDPGGAKAPIGYDDKLSQEDST